jgi:hypothetical protein
MHGMLHSIQLNELLCNKSTETGEFVSNREPTELVQHSVCRGSSHRHKGTASHIIDMVWLYRLPILVERKGVFYFSNEEYTCLRGA